jgi:hypothetical protein
MIPENKQIIADNGAKIGNARIYTIMMVCLIVAPNKNE